MKLLHTSYAKLNFCLKVCYFLTAFFCSPGLFAQGTDYVKLRSVIDGYRDAKSWNESAYNRICVQIRNAATNKLITPDVKKQLLSRAEQEYIYSLSVAVKDFLRTARPIDRSQLAIFRKAIGKVLSANKNVSSLLNEPNNGIANFQSIIGIRSTIMAYTRKEAYTTALSSSLQNQISRLSGGLLAANTNIIQLRNQYYGELNAHKDAHDYYNQTIQRDQKGGQLATCEVFKLYEYYYTACLDSQPKNVRGRHD